MAFNLFPYSNFHKLNTDWILKKLQEMIATITQKSEDVDAAVETVSGYELRLENVEAGVHDLDVSRVSYRHTQELTDEQQQTARGNIGAAPARGVVMYNEAQMLSDTYKAQARTNIGALGSADLPDVSDVLRYSAQTLNSTQQAQARTNIGAAAAGDVPTGVVLYNEQQSLSDAQKAQARDNIGAPSTLDAAYTVKFISQTLNNTQKTQARTNIDAASETETSLELAVCVKTVEQSLNSTEKAQARNNIGAASAGDLSVNVIGAITYDAQDGYTLDASGADIDVLVSALEQADTNAVIYAIDVAGWPGAPSGALYSDLETVKLGAFRVFRATNSDDFIIQGSAAISEAAGLRKILQVTLSMTSNVLTMSGSFIDELLVPAASAGDAGKVLTVSAGGSVAWINPPPAVVTDISSTTATIASAADNTIYKFTQDMTSLSLTAGTGAYMICFHSGTTPTTTSFPVSILGLDDFVPAADTFYEINVMDGRAVWKGWPDPVEE